MDILTRPLQSTKMPRGPCPSTNSTASLGYTVAYLTFSKACRVELDRSQKMRSARSLQVRQLSTSSNPYGESTHPPCDANLSLGLGVTCGCDIAHRRL
jgi:hypothetical protein